MNLADETMKARMSQLLNEKSNSFADLKDLSDAKAFADKIGEMIVENGNNYQALLKHVDNLFKIEQDRLAFEANSQESE